MTTPSQAELLMMFGSPKRVSYVFYAIMGMLIGFSLSAGFHLWEPYIFAPANATISVTNYYRCGFEAVAEMFVTVIRTVCSTVIGVIMGTLTASIINLTYASMGLRRLD